MKQVKVKILDEQNGVTRVSCGGTENIAFLPGTNLGPFGSTIEVAKMLVAPLGSKTAARWYGTDGRETVKQSQGVDYFTAPMYEGDFVVLAQLLVRYHNSITDENSSLYGTKMDKALCRDTFGTLYRRGPYVALQEMESKFNEPR